MRGGESGEEARGGEGELRRRVRGVVLEECYGENELNGFYRDLNLVCSREQIGDTGEDGMSLPNNPQKILLSLPSSASAGILKPKSLNSILGDASSGPSKGFRPLIDSGTNNPTQITPSLAQTVPTHPPITAPLLKSPTTVPLKNPTHSDSPIPNTNFPAHNITHPTSSSVIPTPDLTVPLPPVFPNPPTPANQTQNFAFSAAAEGVLPAGADSRPASSRSKDSISTQKKRGRPLGSKSKTDRSKGVTISGSGSASSTDVLSSTTPAPRVGEKRPSIMGETRSSDLDGIEVCSPAKRPRVTGGALADVDSIMDDPISTETVEDSSRDWPQRGK
ncbi:hypothetical protein RHMOL_Rhmol13G0116700 [Rhododendron molle]|uniref:Uncharacterized protein n=1 Tax=Rhododendron molle TaxID=49168 RepID=A0ACC0L6Y1_RHOML|nr:hypothetical protein RHMOL_Rhmol13G0116700 [Rhododendron molle]